MARASFVNSCPRFASVAFFLCLIEAHLEWPDTGPECRRRGGTGGRDAPAPSLGQQAAWARTRATRKQAGALPFFTVTLNVLTKAFPLAGVIVTFTVIFTPFFVLAAALEAFLLRLTWNGTTPVFSPFFVALPTSVFFDGLP